MLKKIFDQNCNRMEQGRLNYILTVVQAISCDGAGLGSKNEMVYC